MTHVPMEYWIPGSAILAIVTTLALDSIPGIAITEIGLAAMFVFYVVAWAYSPLPQGPHNPKTIKRKRVWGFSVEHEDRAQKELSEFDNGSAE